jgi:dienelactone hydrolase
MGTALMAGFPTEVTVPAGTLQVAGDLVVPDGATGVVVFAHGSGSSRRSARNRAVADALAQAGFATLLLDLLTEQEQALDLHTHKLRFDIELLAERTIAALDWLSSEPTTAALRKGCFGASTGAAAALLAASQRAQSVHAVVSRGGRPDLADASLESVTAPTLLIVGGADPAVRELNRAAQRRLRCESRLEIIPGATHLFEERGALEQVAALARSWFLDKLAS